MLYAGDLDCVGVGCLKKTRQSPALNLKSTFGGSRICMAAV